MPADLNASLSLTPVASCEATDQPVTSAGVLSAWRKRAVPLDPVHKAVHQAILRAFATTGHAPRPAELDAVTAGSDQATTQVLEALHDLDAIRLGADGRIAVAYPFSAAPTRHRVLLGDLGGDSSGEPVEVFAMCAIDALGMPAMLGTTARIESVDLTTGTPITVTVPPPGGRARWDPADAVVFVGATDGGGPSADCCCDYLNFFTDHAAATAWTQTHPIVPGGILDQADAEQLGTDLFGPLLDN